jgi:hypothetical protein
MPIELAEYYINFLKTLALKVTDINIHLFFNYVLIIRGRNIPRFRSLGKLSVLLIIPTVSFGPPAIIFFHPSFDLGKLD